MQYNVYNYSNQLIGQVEAGDAVEAWSIASQKFDGQSVLDVRLSEEYSKTGRLKHEREEEYYREKGFRIVHAGATRNYPTREGIAADLKTSMLEEQTATNAYKKRASAAGRVGDFITKRLWEHIAEEEQGHYNEFKDRLNSLWAD